jgi:mono/diheme cytochrome c family protein
LAAVVVAFVLIAVLLLDVQRAATWGLDLPEPRPVSAANFVTLPQDGSLPKDPGFHWDPAGRAWFHHADQGTTIMPYEWLIALEQPDVRILRRPGLFGDPELFLAPGYMSRFGFLPGADHPSLNPGAKLPLGWAIGRDFVDPTSDRNKPGAYNAKPYNAVGLTCAACHTGRLTYKQLDGKQVDVLIEGGSAMIDLRKLQSALGRAVLYTLYVPFRFDRFATRVLGKDGTSEARGRLREQVSSWMAEAAASQIASEQRHVNELTSGFARTDALTLIGNRVFGPIDPGNVVAAGAPVNFPHIWGTAWFDWVQYNASIKMVMVRNIGEALGVGARTNATPGDDRFLQSTVNVPNLHLIEDQLGGPEPFRGLLAPRWADAVKLAGFPELDDVLVAKGKALYEKKCLQCHGPSVDELKQDLASDAPKYPQFWVTVKEPPPFNRRFLNPPLSDLARIGTDPSQAAGFASRFAQVPDPFPVDPAKVVTGPNLVGSDDPGLGQPPFTTPSKNMITLSAASGLRVITENIRERAYTQAKLTAAQRAEWDRYRDDKPELPDKDIIIANLKYKARPLDGVWATPPYLHNASVPNLEALLSPVALRPARFPVGTTVYDTKLVGFRTDEDPGKFQLDTTLSGNYNTGHEFRDLTLLELESFTKSFDLQSGRSADERWASLFHVTTAEYAAMGEDERRRRRRDLTDKALADRDKNPVAAGDSTYFGVIGSGLDEEERRAIIEYVKSL